MCGASLFTLSKLSRSLWPTENTNFIQKQKTRSLRMLMQMMLRVVNTDFDFDFSGEQPNLKIGAVK
jgi:hypothetical protein